MVKLGQGVRDVVSGVEGIAIARLEWLAGCIRIGVQPPLDKDGKPQELVYVDESQLQIVRPDAIQMPRQDEWQASVRAGGGAIPPSRDPR